MFSSSSSSSSTSTLRVGVILSLLLVVILSLFGNSFTAVVAVPVPRGYILNDGTNEIEWPTETVWDYETERLIFGSYALAPRSFVASWDINEAPTPNTIMIGGDGTTASPGLGPVVGTGTSMRDIFGVTLGHHPTTGALLGYYLAFNADHFLGLITNTAPYTFTRTAGDGTPAFNDATGGLAQVNAPRGMCYHRGARKSWLADGGNNRIREIVYNTGSNDFDVSTLAGTGVAGNGGGSALSATFKMPHSCVVGFSDESTPSFMFITTRTDATLRRLMPVSTTGTVTMMGQMANTVGLNKGLNVIMYEFPFSNEVTLMWADTVNAGARFYKLTRPMIVDPNSGIDGTSTAWNPIQYNIIKTTSEPTMNLALMPNGTVLTLYADFGSYPSFQVWHYGDVDMSSKTRSKVLTRSRSLELTQTFYPGDPRCQPSKSDINTTTGYPPGTIAPVSDSIFDFRSFTPLCCDAVSVPFATTCKNTLLTCTNAVPGVTLWSTLYLLHGTFATDDSARNWALTCVADYITCMRNGYATTPPPNDPICTWPEKAAERLNDPDEAEVFIAAALVGMNKPNVLDIIDKVLAETGDKPANEGGNKAPVSTTASPAELGRSESNFVARIPSCAPTSQYFCQRSYTDSTPDCDCPASTIPNDVNVRSAYSALPATHPTIAAMSSADRACVEEVEVIRVCESRDPNERFASSYTKSIIEYTANGTNYRIGGQCHKKNWKTDACACPYNTTAFEFPMPVLDESSSTPSSAQSDQKNMHLVTFCLPPGRTAFFEGNQQLDISAPACFHPFGSNFSCQCASPGGNNVARKRSIPVSAFASRFDTSPHPGQISFCDTNEEFPPEIDPAIIGTTIGVTIITGASGGSLDAIQSAAIAMTVCTNSSGKSGARQMLVFADIDAANEASGIVFILVVAAALVGLHWFAAVIVCIVLSSRGAPIIDFETGFVVTDAILGDAGSSEPSFWEYWEVAVLKVRYPHWSCMLLRIVYAGFAYEASALIGVGGATMTIAGALCLAICVVYVIFTYYLTAIWMPCYAGSIVITSCPPDVDIETGEFREHSELLFYERKAKKVSNGATAASFSSPSTGANSNISFGGVKKSSSSGAKYHLGNTTLPRSLDSTVGSYAGNNAANSEEMRTSRQSGNAEPDDDDDQVTAIKQVYVKDQQDQQATENEMATNSNNCEDTTTTDCDKKLVTSGKDSALHIEQQSHASPTSTAFTRNGSIMSYNIIDDDHCGQEDGVDADLVNHMLGSIDKHGKMRKSTFSKSNRHGEIGERSNETWIPCCHAPGGDDDEFSIREAIEVGLVGEKRVVRGDSYENYNNNNNSNKKVEEDSPNINNNITTNNNNNNNTNTSSTPLIVRLPPYFVWYTQTPTLSRLPRCLYWWFIPRGWWTQRRFFNRRFATFYNTYMPRAAWWGPAASRLFMLGVSLIRVTDECEFPLLFIGVINIVMTLAYMFTMPMRRPLENYLMILQYALAGALAFTRNVSQEMSVLLFYALFGLAVLTMFHHGCVQLFEIVFTYDQESARFHDAGKAFEESDNGTDLDRFMEWRTKQEQEEVSLVAAAAAAAAAAQQQQQQETSNTVKNDSKYVDAADQ